MCRDNNTVEIRWHGRGGQGAKTACLLLADVAFSSAANADAERINFQSTSLITAAVPMVATAV